MSIYGKRKRTRENFKPADHHEYLKHENRTQMPEHGMQHVFPGPHENDQALRKLQKKKRLTNPNTKGKWI